MYGKTTKVIDLTIPITLSDLKRPIDLNAKLTSILDRPNYARAFLFFAIKFVNEGATRVSVIEVADAIVRARSHTQEILRRFVSLGVLDEHREGSRIFFGASNSSLFEEFWEVAKLAVDRENGNEHSSNTD